ncbi:Opacity protein [Bryocella elongata]|uniref:Opacity protein n=1 Tax=Bryocella elongata TaxID=863522 RepID=A0A1H5X496_9BACT|nr:outer membrane beta-barrel protein [Bryocella elongata]SEG06551.1 Opacity protein [Bryocella elongata]
MKRILTALLLSLSAAAALGQAGSTASRKLDLQVGGGYSNGKSDYTLNRLGGFMIYADADFMRHIGVELNFHQISDPNSPVYERTYEAGARYFRDYGRFRPYVKGLYGRGVFNSPVYDYYVQVACTSGTCTYQLEETNFNLAYNMMVGGAGVDISIVPRVNARVDYEYQKWFSGPGLTNGLTPQIISIGVAYHFPAGRPVGYNH